MLNKLHTTNNWLDYQFSRRLRWPKEVYINMTSRCNKKCEFCTYDHELFKDARLTTLEDIKRMTWLKHAKLVGLWCGNGESLTNPQFEDILDYVRATWPHVETSLSTNGILLTSSIANKITHVNVSLNTSKMTPALANALIRTKTNKCLSFVMTLDNIHEIPDFVLTARRMGAIAVLAHCMFHSWSGSRPLSVNKSCYNDPEKTNHYLRLARSYAQTWGVQLWAPPLLNQPAYICRGTPTKYNLPYCTDPFKRVYLTIDEYAQPSMVVCCSGCYFDVRYDITRLTPEYFKSLWTRKEFTHLRHTVNKPKIGGNPLCEWCKSTNRFLPTAFESYEHVKDLVRKGLWIK